jgi:uncharacterized alpha-E superfamily protein
MNQLLTTNVAGNLYWFGRHIERIEATLIEIITVYDKIIDVDKKAGVKLYKQLGVEIEYNSSSEFLDVAIFQEHNANLYNIIVQARENAIIARTNIATEAFGSVIQLFELFEQAHKSAYIVDFRFINEALSLISEIWGELTQKLQRKNSDYFIRLGKLVEKVDFHLRLGRNKEFALIMMDEIDTIVSILAPNAAFKPHDENEAHEIILQSINGKINKIIVEVE